MVWKAIQLTLFHPVVNSSALSISCCLRKMVIALSKKLNQPHNSGSWKKVITKNTFGSVSLQANGQEVCSVGANRQLKWGAQGVPWVRRNYWCFSRVGDRVVMRTARPWNCIWNKNTDNWFAGYSLIPYQSSDLVIDQWERSAVNVEFMGGQFLSIMWLSDL